MKMLKYVIIAGCAVQLASAQGLFDIAKTAGLSESSPLKFDGELSYGYDENVNPTSGQSEESSSYIKAALGATVVKRNARTSWDANVAVSASRYFDVDQNDYTANVRAAVNINHRINERTRWVSRNFFNYGLDLGSFYGPITSRQSDEFVYFSVDNAIGYRWSERSATYTGISYSSAIYEAGENDVDLIGVYNTFRYSASKNTVVTAGYRYTRAMYEVGSSSRNSQYISLGLENQITSTSFVSFDFGVQISEQASPYGQIEYSKRVAEHITARASARYSIEDTDAVFGAGRYNDKQALRIAGAVDYRVSPKLLLTAGGNYVHSDFSGGTVASLVDSDWDLVNTYVGATLDVSDALKLRFSINYTNSDANGSIQNRSYDRIRYELGLNYAF